MANCPQIKIFVHRVQKRQTCLIHSRNRCCQECTGDGTGPISANVALGENSLSGETKYLSLLFNIPHLLLTPFLYRPCLLEDIQLPVVNSLRDTVSPWQPPKGDDKLIPAFWLRSKVLLNLKHYFIVFKKVKDAYNVQPSSLSPAMVNLGCNWTYTYLGISPIEISGSSGSSKNMIKQKKIFLAANISRWRWPFTSEVWKLSLNATDSRYS